MNYHQGENTLLFLPASYELSVPIRGDKKPNKPLHLTDILLFSRVGDGGLGIGCSLSSYLAKCGAKGWRFEIIEVSG